MCVLSRENDVSATLSNMAAEGCEEMSGNGELEDSSGSFIFVHTFQICSCATVCASFRLYSVFKHFESFSWWKCCEGNDGELS